MKTDNTIELKASRVRFFSSQDEAAFFSWIEKIPSIKSCEGRGSVIYMYVIRDVINENDLRELLSLFRRYGVDMKQLSIFDDNQFSSWFRDKNAYWYASVFAS